ncbi:uncharacterized protein LOC109606858 [Aethina tumida]|uniref:uncharacterized protein LOC109606858 n=1 Tax=Aethina tumida TaxID=116153 RepID=UPI002148DEAE|nr:uncharacterized protein LOC109606858 [Aethina tumida]
MNAPKHQCRLHLFTEDHVVNKFVQTGIFISLRRKIKLCSTVSVDHPKTQLYFLSNSALLREQNRHLLYYYNMVHPLSMISFWIETTEIFVFSLIYLNIAVIIYFNQWKHVLYNCVWAYMTIVVVGLFIIYTFFRGYISKEKIILDQKLVASKYFKTFFLYDIAVFFLLICIAVINNVKVQYFLQLFTILPFLIRVYLRYDNIIKYVTKYKFIVKLIRLTYVVVIVLFLILINYFHLLMFNSDYFKSTHAEITTIFEIEISVLYIVIIKLAGMYDTFEPQPDTLQQYILTFLLVTISIIMRFVIFLYIFRWYNNYIAVKKQKMDFYDEFQMYAKHKELPSKLKRRMNKYFNYKYGSNFYHTDVIFSALPLNLREEMYWVMYEKLLVKISLYSVMPHGVLKQMACNLDMLYYLSGDFIVEHGAVGNSMFLIYCGSVAVYTKEMKEICHLNEGDYFGEFTMILNIPRTANVVAITQCKIIQLTRENFQHSVKAYPEVVEKLQELCRRRLEMLKTEQVI